MTREEAIKKIENILTEATDKRFCVVTARYGKEMAVVR